MAALARHMRAGRVALVCAAVMAAGACARHPRAAVAPASPMAIPSAALAASDVIAEVKDFAVALGGHSTGNFLRRSDHQISDNRCYFTGKLQLPEFYSTLTMVREDEATCTARTNEHDVFFYPVEAVASGEETITVSLAEASTERVLVVVPHEDFHNQREARNTPTEVAEAAATLVGFLTARGYAADRFGPDSDITRALSRDADLFLRKSFIINRYYDQVSAVYREVQSGALAPAQALDRKAELFDELRRSCGTIAPEPVSFNKCPAAMNNAGLAFDRTYTRYYPMLYDLYTLLGGDAAQLVFTLKHLMTNWPSSAANATELIIAQ